MTGNKNIFFNLVIIPVVLKPFLNVCTLFRKSKSWYKDALSLTSQHTTMNFLSVTFGIWTAISLLMGYVLEGDNLAGYEAIPILLLLFINVSFEMYDNKLRHAEVPNRVRAVLQKMEDQMKFIHWTENNYPDLYSPLSPCITLQWTFRDGKLVNLPWALLVKDDIILMKPGKSKSMKYFKKNL